MTFAEFCLRFVQISLHVVWFAFIPLFFAWLSMVDEEEFRTSPNGGVFLILIGGLSYALLIIGYLNGWNV